ncbi:MAG: EAL domain-containing protein [Methylococcaceae bacterium]|nr:MAG: EAL domain-containing protein [Methylococcaceae bacterium]
MKSLLVLTEPDRSVNMSGNHPAEIPSMFSEQLNLPPSGDFMPHGMCLLWNADLLWLHVVSDLLIAASYYSIPAALAYFALKRKDLEFRWIFLLFAVFIVACGTTHLMGVWTIWQPDYLADGLVKLVTAVTSVSTAILLWPLIPQALGLTSPAVLRQANAKLQEEVALRLRSEAALRESEERWKFALEGAGEGVWDYNLLTGAVVYSKRYKAMYGLVEDENGKVSHEWRDCVHPEDMPRVLANLRAYLDGKAPAFATEYRMLCRDGNYKWILDRAILISRTEDGKPLRMIGTHADITDRKALEKQLIAEILDSSPEATLLVGADGLIKFANGVVPRVLGYSQTELVGSNIDVLVPAQLRTAHAQMRGDYMHAPLPRSMGLNRQLTATRKDGGDIPVEVSLSPIAMDNQTFIIATVVDISARMRSEAAIKAANELNRQIIESAQEGIIVYDLDGRFSIWNPFMESITGVGRQDCLGKLPIEVFSFLLETGIPDGIRRALAGETVKNPPFRWSAPQTGRSGWASSVQAPLYGSDEQIIGVIETVSDITEMQLAATVYKAIGEAIMVADADNRIVAVNPAFTRLTGYSEAEAVGQTTKLLKSGRQDQAFYRDMWLALEKTGHWQGEIHNRRKNGEVYLEWLAISTIYDEQGHVLQHVAMFSDITDQKRAEQIIWQQANFDPLTGLPNRRMFYDRLDMDIKKANRTGLPLALMFLDLDRFKIINDTLGHDVGDMLLKEAAQRLSGCVREIDTVARLGGDEFTVILGEMSTPGTLERIAQDILGKLAEPFRLGNEINYVSASLGITFYPGDAGSIDELLKNADQAMYAAKSRGGNRYSYFTHSMQEAAQARMRLTNDMRGALAGRQFQVYYQPIVELASGAIRKAEALLRWRHPTRGLVDPADFIPIAEENGLIVEIGNWVFRQAAHQAASWRAAYHPEFQISVNKSPVQFHNEKGIHAPWFEYLQTLDLPGQSIVVEITEGLLLDIGAVVSRQLLAFRDAGIQVAIDDFGTGYSALSYLKKFDIDYLKIDQSFVCNLAPYSHDMILCEAIIVMAHKLGMKVIAEGVETEEQRALLVAAGCDYAQGYLFARPMPARDFEELLVVDIGTGAGKATRKSPRPPGEG